VARVEVELERARDRRLPLVSVRSGRRADGYAPAGRPLGAVQLPLTQAEFDELLRLRSRQRSGLRLAPVFVLAGVALSRYPALLPLGLVTAFVSLLLAAVATFAIRRHLPSVSIDAGSARVTLRRVDPHFAEVVHRAGG
jgi:hypothetical protein